MSTQRQRRPHRQHRGLGFVVVILMLGIVSMVAASISLRTQRSLKTSSDQAVQQAGDDTAYSGLQVGLARAATAGDDWTGLDISQAMPRRNDLAYRLVVTSNLSQAQPLLDSDGTEIPGESAYIKSLAYQNQALISGMCAVVSQQRGMAFNYPAFGSDRVTVEESLIQAVAGEGSWDSTEWIPVSGDGHIRTNGTLEGSVSLGNQSYVDGDVIVGPGGDPVTALQSDNGSGFSGTADVAGAALPLPQVVANYDPNAPNAPGGTTVPIPIPILNGYLNSLSFQVVPPGTYNELSFQTGEDVQPSIMNGPYLNHVYLPAGDYYVNKVTTADSSVLNVVFSDGEVRLHVKDSVDLDNISVTNDSAALFQIYQTDPNGTVKLANVDGSFVLASQGEVTVDQSKINGAVYGSAVNIKQSQLSYPKALDGLALNDKIKGEWSLYGVRRLSPSELETLRSQLFP